MSTQSISDQIRALNTALQNTTTVDTATRGQLNALQAEIARVVEHHDVPVTERLEAIAVRFEADHPAVGSALREAINALSKAGI